MVKTTHKSKQTKKAFIFTTDAFLVLPIVILAISAFIAFTITLKDTNVFHGYAYLVARDSMAYMDEVTSSEAGLGFGGDRPVLDYIVTQIANGDLTGANQTLTIVLDNTVPSSVGYIFEYYDLTQATPSWVKLREAGNLFKIKNPKFQISDTKLVTGLSDPQLLVPDSCGSAFVCSIPTSYYTEGKVNGPYLLRMRAFI